MELLPLGMEMKISLIFLLWQRAPPRGVVSKSARRREKQQTSSCDFISD